MFSDVFAGLDLNQGCRCDLGFRLETIEEVISYDPREVSFNAKSWTFLGCSSTPEGVRSRLVCALDPHQRGILVFALFST